MVFSVVGIGIFFILHLGSRLFRPFLWFQAMLFST